VKNFFLDFSKWVSVHHMVRNTMPWKNGHALQLAELPSSEDGPYQGLVVDWILKE